MSKILFLLISLLLASRSLHVAPDDSSYLDHFSGDIYVGNGWLEYIIEEPLWAIYTIGLGNFFGPEWALRLTIFLSCFIFLNSSFKLMGDRSLLFLILIFVFSSQLATQLYFNQIRQGVALTIFIFGFSYGFKKGIIASLIASMVHTSLLIVFAGMFIVRQTKKNKVWKLFFAVALLFCVFIPPGFLDVRQYYELIAGRRFGVHSLEQALNLNFFILWPPVYYGALLVMKKFMVSNEDRLFWRFNIVFVTSVLGLSFFFEAAGRVLYFVYIFIPIVIARGFPRLIPTYLAGFWVLIIVAYNTYEYFKEPEVVNSLFGRWGLILFGS